MGEDISFERKMTPRIHFRCNCSVCVPCPTNIYYTPLKRTPLLARLLHGEEEAKVNAASLLQLSFLNKSWEVWFKKGRNSDRMILVGGRRNSKTRHIFRCIFSILHQQVFLLPAAALPMIACNRYHLYCCLWNGGEKRRGYTSKISDGEMRTWLYKGARPKNIHRLGPSSRSLCINRFCPRNAQKFGNFGIISSSVNTPQRSWQLKDVCLYVGILDRNCRQRQKDFGRTQGQLCGRIMYPLAFLLYSSTTTSCHYNDDTKEEEVYV